MRPQIMTKIITVAIFAAWLSTPALAQSDMELRMDQLERQQQQLEFEQHERQREQEQRQQERDWRRKECAGIGGADLGPIWRSINRYDED